MEFAKQQYMATFKSVGEELGEQQGRRGAAEEHIRTPNMFSYTNATSTRSTDKKIEESSRSDELNTAVFQGYYTNHHISHSIMPSLSDTKPDSVLRFGSPVPAECIEGAFGVTESNGLPSQIMSHPLYPRLVTAYMNCQKVGAPPELVAGLDEISKHYQNYQNSHCIQTSPGFTSDPELDQFMEEYSNLLQTYHEELTRPFTEAMTFFQRIELQLESLSKPTTVALSHPDMILLKGHGAPII